MNGVTKEQIEKAREMDLVTYLSQYEPHELVRLSSSTFCTKSHDSLKISNGAWMWFSRGFGGYTALDYLVKVKGVSFVDAVKFLSGYSNESDLKAKNKKSECKSASKLILPLKNKSADRVYAYLTSRGIDSEIIDWCVENRYLYESYEHGHAVFVGYDREGISRYAGYRGTGKDKVMGDAYGSDKRYSFRIINPESTSLHLFECPIDLLSYGTLLKMNGEDWKKDNLISLAGVYTGRCDGKYKMPAVLGDILSSDNIIKNIYLHFDNDVAGKKAAEGLAGVLAEEYKVVNAVPPYGKDYNDYLLKILSDERRDECGKRKYD